MIKNLGLFFLSVFLLATAGCVKDKAIYEKFGALEKKFDALEKKLKEMSGEVVQEKPFEAALEDSPVLGKKDALIHLVVFSNFSCPYCAKADLAFRELIKDPELSQKINVVFKHFPFERHPNSRPAAKASFAALDQGKFWEYSDKLFNNQATLSPENYKKWAKEVGLDVAKFEADLKANDKIYEEKIDRDIKLGAQVNLLGTPWILLNGWIYEGGLNPADFKKFIAEKHLGEKADQKP